MLPRPSCRPAAAGAVAAAVVFLLALGPSPAAGATPSALVGTFRITAGSCAGAAPTGTYLRMILPTGSRSGPFLSNADSTCSDQTFTPLAPGADGGLVTGAHQPEPSPAFDTNGNSLATRIIEPAGFFGVAFGASTNPTDPQTGQAAPAPTVTVDGTGLTGDLSAFAASWNDQEFNQGAPKAGGGLPGNTAIATGSFDPATGAFTLEWTSQVEGGPFDRFTGLWHLEGTFVPAGGATAADAGAALPADGAGDAGSAPPGSAAATGPGVTGTPGAVVGADAADGAGIASAPDAAGAASATEVASSAASAGVVTRTVAGEDGWAPPAWLVLLVAGLGLGALTAYIRFDRVVRALVADAVPTEAPTEAQA
jgi:hypothetical protein